MWVHFRDAPNQIVAEMWQELLEYEGIPVRITLDPEKPGTGLTAPRRIYVPMNKNIVAAEVLRKL